MRCKVARTRTGLETGTGCAVSRPPIMCRSEVKSVTNSSTFITTEPAPTGMLFVRERKRSRKNAD